MPNSFNNITFLGAKYWLLVSIYSPGKVRTQAVHSMLFTALYTYLFFPHRCSDSKLGPGVTQPAYFRALVWSLMIWFSVCVSYSQLKKNNKWINFSQLNLDIFNERKLEVLVPLRLGFQQCVMIWSVWKSAVRLLIRIQCGTKAPPSFEMKRKQLNLVCQLNPDFS